MKGRGKGVEGEGGEEVGNGRNSVSVDLISPGKLDATGHITGGNQSALQRPKSGAGVGAAVVQSRTPKGSSQLCPRPTLPASIPPSVPEGVYLDPAWGQAGGSSSHPPWAAGV